MESQFFWYNASASKRLQYSSRFLGVFFFFLISLLSIYLTSFCFGFFVVVVVVFFFLNKLQ